MKKLPSADPGLDGLCPAAFSAPAGTLSVHILDQQTGMPPSDVTVTLEKQQQDKWTPIASGKTDHDGRIKSLYPQDQDMQPGVYKVTFKTAEYFHGKKLDSFFPEIPVLFTVTAPTRSCTSASAEPVRLLDLQGQLRRIDFKGIKK
jgi:5-hydroxyisourate hydrolase